MANKKQINKRMKQENIAETNPRPEESPLELTIVRQRLKQRYPDETPGDTGGWDQVYNRYMDDTDAELGYYKEAECRLNELCQVYPEFAEVVREMTAGQLPFRAAVAKVFALEDLIPQEGDEDYDAYHAAYGERLAQVKKRGEQSREIEDNEAKSLETIDLFCEEKGLADEEKESLIGIINDHFTELLYKRVSPEMLEGFLKQMSFDTAVTEAAKAGEIRGRNEKIEAKRAQERALAAGDGLPGIGGGGAVSPADAPRRRNFFELPERKGI